MNLCMYLRWLKPTLQVANFNKYLEAVGLASADINHLIFLTQNKDS
jgi:hypothetical protein